MTYFEIAKRKKTFPQHKHSLASPFISFTQLSGPQNPPLPPQPSEVQPGHCMNAHQNADGAHQNLGIVSWSVNGIVWSVGKTIFDNSSVLVIWFSLGPFSRVLSDFLHGFFSQIYKLHFISQNSIGSINLPTMVGKQPHLTRQKGCENFQTWTW